MMLNVQSKFLVKYNNKLYLIILALLTHRFISNLVRITDVRLNLLMPNSFVIWDVISKLSYGRSIIYIRGSIVFLYTAKHPAKARIKINSNKKGCGIEIINKKSLLIVYFTTQGSKCILLPGCLVFFH